MAVSPSPLSSSPTAAAAPRLNLAEMDVSPELFTLVPRRIAELHEVVPVFRQNGTLTVAMARPENLVAVDELQRLTGLKIRAVRVTAEELQRAMVRFYASEGGGAARMAAVEEEAEGDVDHILSLSAEAQAAESAPAIRLLNHIMEQAIAQRASDIHIQPGERGTVVRLPDRWRDVYLEHPAPGPARRRCISRIKVLARMNIAERRLPLDGRFRVRLHQPALRRARLHRSPASTARRRCCGCCPRA